MAKTTKALSGASQDAYFRRLLKAEAGLSAEDRNKLVDRLRKDIAQLRLRKEVPREVDQPPPEAETVKVAEVTARPFDPFSPNVVLVLRKSGRDAAVAALEVIGSPDDLRTLAREQRLTVPSDLASASALREAIVTAAAKRIANRMAAAG